MKIESLRKSFDNRTLFENLSFEIQSGILVLKGQSGCGKSTFISIIMGKEKQDIGDVIFGENEKDISYCGQENLIPPSYSLSSFCKFLKIYDNPRYRELLKELKFEEKENEELFTLSGGERQKAEIIVSLLKEADIYIFDEPLSALDKKSKEIVIKKLENIGKNKLVILVNHDTSVFISYSLLIDFDNGLKISYGDFKSSCCNNSIKYVDNHKNSLLLFSETFLKENKLFSIIQICLLLFSMICMSLFSCFNSNLNYKQSNLLSLKNDPISIHDLTLKITSEDEIIKALSFIDDGNSIFKVDVGLNQFYLCDFLEEDKFQYLADDNFIQLFGSKITCSDDKEFEIIKFADDIDYEAIKCVNDNYSDETYIFTSKKLLKEMILNGLGNYKIGNKSLEFSSDLNLKLGLSKYFKYDISIVDDRKYFSIPDLNEDANVYLDNGITVKNSYIDNSNNIKISYDLFKVLLLCNKNKNDDFYRCTFKREELISLIENNSFVFASGVISNYIKSDTISLIFLVISIVLFVSLIIFDFLSMNGLKEYKKRIKQIYLNNNLKKYFKKDILLFSLLSTFIICAVVMCLYPLNLYLCNLMPAFIVRNTGGTGLYSKLPMNSYYEGIYSPIKFLSGDLYFLINIGFAFIFSCVLFYSLLSERKVK